MTGEGDILQQSSVADSLLLDIVFVFYSLQFQNLDLAECSDKLDSLIVCFCINFFYYMVLEH